MAGTDATKPDWVAKHNADLSAEERRLREQNPIVSTKPLYTLPMTAAQQIRAKALEHTVQLAIIDGSMRGPGEIREMCDIFERYIREGK